MGVPGGGRGRGGAPPEPPPVYEKTAALLKELASKLVRRPGEVTMKRVCAQSRRSSCCWRPAFRGAPEARRAQAGDELLVARQGRQAGSALALKGKVVLLDFWATWCAGCKVEIPWFIEFDKAYRSKGLAAVGVSMDDEGWKTIEPYLKKHPISYTIVAGNFDTAAPYSITALPVTVLIDRAGGWPRSTWASWPRSRSRPETEAAPRRALT
jgi:cytochrome c biogenesis protein CcmG/thiol:disulfide interchange protein DsbE